MRNKILSFLAILLTITALSWAGPKFTHQDAYAPGSVAVTGGTIDGAIIGKTTPAELWGSPNVAKGPAIINSGFTGTISRSTTTLTFSSAADAILAGYSATNPVLGTTVIHPTGPVTMYITAWLSSATATVDSSGTLAAQTPTSVQLPIATFVNSAGITQGWMNAAGNVYFAGAVTPSGTVKVLSDTVTSALSSGPGIELSFNIAGDFGYLVGFNRDNGTYKTIKINDLLFVGTGSTGNILTGGLTAAGTSAVKVVAIAGGTMPTALVADAVQMGVAEYNGATGDQRLNIYSEATVAKKTAIGSGTVSINGAVTSGGGFTRQLAEATGTPAGTTTNFVITLSIPTGARLLGCQLRVDTALTAGETWKADYSGGSTTVIAAAGQAVAKNTKINKLHVDEIATNTTNVTITRDAGNFTNGVGVIRAIAYYEALDILADAP